MSGRSSRFYSALKACSHQYGVDLAIALGIGIIAVGLRIPYFSEIPRWTDEVGEALTALRIAQGSVTPFVGMVPYYGPVHADLLALVLRFYQDPLVPRLFNLLMGSLTAVVTYLFGRAIHNRLAGVVAGLLLATSSTHIVVNSHIAYGSDATPFFSTLACVFLLLAVSRNNAWLFGAAGVYFAFAVQTHPVAVAIAPGLVLWFLLSRSRWSWFRRPGLYLAGLATIAAYSPVIIPIALNPYRFQFSIATRSYANATEHSAEAYLGNLQNLIVEVWRMVGAQYLGASRPLLYLADPLILAFALIVPAALIVSVRRGRSLPAFVLASAGLIVPYFLKQYEDFPYFTRYVALLLPPIYVLVGSIAADVWESFRAGIWLRQPSIRKPGRLLVCLLVIAIIVLPFQRTLDYYGRQALSGSTNAPFLEIVRYLEAQQNADILLDESLREGEFPSGGNLYRSFRVWFAFDAHAFQSVDIQRQDTIGLCPGSRPLLIASASAAAKIGTGCRSIQILTYDIPTRPGRGNLRYGLYELSPAD